MADYETGEIGAGGWEREDWETEEIGGSDWRTDGWGRETSWPEAAKVGWCVSNWRYGTEKLLIN
ncbi:hypothetical protein [Paenibacillus sp. YN15]|uniref:hypothetical protein n=1 Tax=Paenibacillus sp. YN15 TaxID=1742774 RepID=UPI000DCEF83A|nr:hypothetical protein [Paenibacillus sp. YN15]RAV00515.1 hypothetical protein DQG13_13805 [Paenibacillus sp. YN15]